MGLFESRETLIPIRTPDGRFGSAITGLRDLSGSAAGRPSPITGARSLRAAGEALSHSLAKLMGLLRLTVSSSQ